jgi:hypothetical protein
VKELTLVRGTTSQHNHLRHGELSYASGVTEGCIIDWDAVNCRLREVDLVSADTEASDSKQALSSFKHLFGHLSLGTDTKNVHARDYLEELGFTQSVFKKFRLVSSLDQAFDTSLMDPFKQEDLHLFPRERILLFHGGML